MRLLLWFVLAVALAGQAPPSPLSVRMRVEGVPWTGPQAGIACPAGALPIPPGTNISAVVASSAGTTTFCLKAGVHAITSAITPKTGNTFVGEYGAILDGTGWTTTDPNVGAFTAHNQNIDDVTIQNLVIRHMPQRGIHAFYWMSDRWTIDHNELAYNKYGLNVPSHSVVSHNAIHHNVGNAASSVPADRGGGYGGYRSVGTRFESNDIAYNGPEQKMMGTSGITFRRNVVHHNLSDGIWFDADNTDVLIEENTVEDHPREGIFYEISGVGTIRHNVVRRNGGSGIFISTSKDVTIAHNTLDDNFRSIQYFLNCGAVGGGRVGWDLANTVATDNLVHVGARSGALANGFTYLSACTATQAAPYVNGSKNLKFLNTRYTVPTTTTRYWFWGLSSLKDWTAWQAIGHDATGTVGQR